MKVVTQQFTTQIKKKDSKPITGYWKNARIILNQSINSCVSEILNANINDEVVKINLIGPPSSGKSTLGKTLCHQIHEKSMKEQKVPYIVKIFGRDDLMEMEQTLSTLQPLNHVLMFDDISWLQAGNSKSKIDQLQKTFTEIRHLPGGQDVKIIIIFNFHYNFAIAKHLRQADFFFYTDIGSSELENMEKVVGIKNKKKCLDFIRVKQQIKKTSKHATMDKKEYHGNFSYQLGGKMKFTYQTRAPFTPSLFWNRDTLRHVVFPKREWIDPVCNVCDQKEDFSKDELANFEQLRKNAPYTPDIMKNAARILLFQKGINCWSPNVKRALSWLERSTKNVRVDPKALIELFELKEVKVKTNKPLADLETKKEETQED